MKYFDSPEATALKKLIESKKKYLSTLTKEFAYQQLQKEIMLLENEILPVILNNTSVIHAEFVKYATKCYDTALAYRCNGLLIYQPIDENYIGKPIIGVVNPRANKRFGTFGAIEIYIDNMDANGVQVSPQNLPLDTLMP